jgi:hypothetical protein
LIGSAMPMPLQNAAKAAVQLHKTAVQIAVHVEK